MKKIKYVLFSLFSFAFGAISVYAAPSHSISVNKSQVEVGQTVTATVTVKNAAAWNVRINGTGNTNGCSTSAADSTANGKNTTKSFSVTCRANSTGVIRITYSGDATSEDNQTVSVNGATKPITVVAPRPKSGNNNLKSLSVDGAVITPEFNPDTLEYSATFEPGTEKVVINAEKADGYASITGPGEKDVVEGDNRFEIVVTSETGVSKTYVININVKEFEPILVEVDGQTYSLVRKLKDIVGPENFVETSVTINDEQIPAFYNEKLDKTIVCLKDENGNISFFEYKDGKYSKYLEFTFEKQIINFIKMDEKLLPLNYIKYEIEFNGQKIIAYKLNKKSNFALVYGVDVSTGKKYLYQVDIKNNTIQLYNNDYEKVLDKYTKFGLIAGASLLFIILIEFIAILLLKKKNRKIKNKIKSERIEKIKEAAIKEAKSETVEEEKKIKKSNK